jgi:hypothetical protein
MPRPRDDDDRFIDAVDEHGVVRDGKAIRVSMLMADAVRAPTAQLHDGYGGPVGGKPGFVVSDTGQAIRNRAYRQSIIELTRLTRGDPRAMQRRARRPRRFLPPKRYALI